jgi:hypothetical protein
MPRQLQINKSINSKAIFFGIDNKILKFAEPGMKSRGFPWVVKSINSGAHTSITPQQCQ